MSHKYDHMRKLLHDACMLKAIEDLKAFPPDEEIAKMHEFSPQFKKNMEKMMEECFGPKKRERELKQQRRKQRITAIKKISATAAIVFAFVFGCAMAIEDVREAFVKYILRIYDDHLSITTTSGPESNLKIILDYYEPSWIPVGYVETGRNQTLYRNMIQYEKDNQILMFNQKLILDQSVRLFDYDSENSTIIEIPGFGNYVITEKFNCLMWSDEEYTFAIIGKLTMQHMLQMANALLTD